MAEPIIEEFIRDPVMISVNPYIMVAGVCIGGLYLLTKAFKPESSPITNPEENLSREREPEDLGPCFGLDGRDIADKESDAKKLEEILRKSEEFQKASPTQKQLCARDGGEMQARIDFASLSGVAKEKKNFNGKYACLKILQDNMTAILRNYSMDSDIPSLDIHKEKLGGKNEVLYKIRYPPDYSFLTNRFRSGNRRSSSESQ
jgi:hypothetical protein